LWQCNGENFCLKRKRENKSEEEPLKAALNQHFHSNESGDSYKTPKRRESGDTPPVTVLTG
jgi:hypothetical protein